LVRLRRELLPIEFLTKDIWVTISEKAKNATTRHVAVAYIGKKNSKKLLPLDKGDRLVVDMSDRALETGQTNPHEIEKYMKKKVRAYNCPNLHAKVFVFDDIVIVGSTNLSSSSENDLIEAAMLCKNIAVAKEVSDWISTLKKRRITQNHIKRAKKIYKPPNWKKVNRTGLWILSTSEIKKYDDKEEERRDEIESQVSKKISLRKFDVESIRWDDDPRITERVQEGDRIIQIYNDENDEITVYPPAVLKKITHYLTLDKKEKRTFLTIATPKHSKDVSWSKFSNVAKNVGLPNISKNSKRSVPSKATDMLLSLWG
jgi:hypothetical protein